MPNLESIVTVYCKHNNYMCEKNEITNYNYILEKVKIKLNKFE